MGASLNSEKFGVYSIILFSPVLMESRETGPTAEPRAPRIYFTSGGMATLATELMKKDGIGMGRASRACLT